jgi:hypothetical protein
MRMGIYDEGTHTPSFHPRSAECAHTVKALACLNGMSYQAAFSGTGVHALRNK